MKNGLGNGFKFFEILGAKPRVFTISYGKKRVLDPSFEVGCLNYPTRFTLYAAHVWPYSLLQKVDLLFYIKHIYLVLILGTSITV